jgi:RHS repeat-associated protein
MEAQAQPDGSTGGCTQSCGYITIGDIISTTAQGTFGYAPPGTGAARPHAVITTSVGFSATYDANGNMLTRIEVLPGGRYTCTQAWDAANRLVSVTQGGVTTTFIYNGDGNRVKVNANGVITVYVGNLYEVNPGTGVTTTYYYLGAHRIAMRTAAGVTWLSGDHLGSASLATNSAGAKVSDERYLPYGATRSGPVPTDYQFTGQKLDTGTGLYYYGARYYDPVVGRFISADTIVPSPGNPQALNRYAYV